MLVSPATAVALVARITFIEASIPGKPILLIRFRLQPATIKRAGKTLNREAEEESGFGRFQSASNVGPNWFLCFFGGSGRNKSTPLLHHDFTTSSLKLLSGNSFNNNEQNLFFFWASKNEQLEQTIGLTNDAAQRPASGHFRLVANADTEKNTRTN